MLSVAAGLASSPDEADDIYQDAMINAYKALPKFRKDAQFKTWLYRIVVNAAMDHHRKLKSKLKYFVTNTASSDDGEPFHREYEQYECSESNENSLHNQRLAVAITKALESLSANEKIAFVLCHQQGLKMEDAAGVMQCSVGAVKNFLFRSRQKMREKLEPYVR